MRTMVCKLFVISTAPITMGPWFLDHEPQWEMGGSCTMDCDHTVIMMGSSVAFLLALLLPKKGPPKWAKIAAGTINNRWDAVVSCYILYRILLDTRCLFYLPPTLHQWTGSDRRRGLLHLPRPTDLCPCGR